MNENQGRLLLEGEPEGLVDAAWVAEALGVTVRFVRRLVAERRIPCVKLGGPVRFERVAVRQFIAECRRPPVASDSRENVAASLTTAPSPKTPVRVDGPTRQGARVGSRRVANSS